MIAQEAKWIWINEDPQKNEYAYFAGEFEWNGEKAIFSIVAETDYILYINERRVAFGQFAGYPTEKYCDEIDISRRWLQDIIPLYHIQVFHINILEQILQPDRSRASYRDHHPALKRRHFQIDVILGKVVFLIDTRHCN